MKLLLSILALAVTLPAQAALDWEAALEGGQRGPAHRARDEFRHPQETLEFFGLREGMTVVELSPGAGWYTEILAPLLLGDGRYYVANASPNGSAYARRSLGAFLMKLGSDPDVYGETIVTELEPPNAMAIAPEGSADLVLAFRNIHSWLRAGVLDETFAAVATALRSGGTFGVVQHRAKPGTDVETMKNTGYVTRELIIDAAQRAGLEFEESSEINANPKDPADHERGVWSLPPNLAVPDDQKPRFAAIGESDRMTLRFRKP